MRPRTGRRGRKNGTTPRGTTMSGTGGRPPSRKAGVSDMHPGYRRRSNFRLPWGSQWDFRGTRRLSMSQTKGRIRHVALSVEDPWETAEFYKDALGLQEVTELDGPLAEGVFLTDGVVNLAILHFKTDEASQGTGKDYVGIHHIGFWVDDVVEQGKIARNAGATWIMGDPSNPDGYEVKHTDLSGIIFDIAAHGWAGSQKDPGSDENVVHPNPRRRLAKFDDRRARAEAKIASMRAKEVAAAAE